VWIETLARLPNETRKKRATSDPANHHGRRDVMGTPADWYPQADGQLRYWDGQAWTEHFASGTGQRNETATTDHLTTNTTGEPMRSDIAAAKSKMARDICVGRAIKKLESYVDPDEHVDGMVTGKFNDDGRGLLVLTDRRMIFIIAGMLHCSTEDFTFRNISSVAWSSGVFGGSVAICSGGDYTYIEKVDKSNGAELVSMARTRLANPGPTVSAPSPAAAGSNLLEQLKQMGELHDAGVVTDEEFAAKKMQILAQM
jgi:Bacterial PH domain/Short C-terminal domain/Protein of unknown function (DUF2510)